MQNQSKLYKVLLDYFDTQRENVLYGSCLLSVLSANCITRCGDQNLVHTLAEYWSKLGLYMGDIIILLADGWLSVDGCQSICQQMCVSWVSLEQHLHYRAILEKYSIYIMPILGFHQSSDHVYVVGHVYIVDIVTYSSCPCFRIRGWDVTTAKFRTKWTSSFQTENKWPKAITAWTIIGSVLMLLCVCVISCKMWYNPKSPTEILKFAQLNY